MADIWKVSNSKKPDILETRAVTNVKIWECFV